VFASNALGLIYHRPQDDTQGLTPLREIDFIYSNAVCGACEGTIGQIGISSQQSVHIPLYLPTFDRC
jgi:hypothetical protein